ncbi:MAG TPA: hypothetical protein VHV82_01170 [Sporichthyaceae bacterium]|nr:hypothetical protein [Sporichthyaceae bacterium]
MNIARLGGVVAGALLAVPLLSPIAASAAVQTPAAVAPVSYASDCEYTHWWNGSWHRHVRLVCDNDGYYGGGYRGHDRGGDFRGNHGGNHGGDHGGNHGGGDHRRGGR